MTDIYLPYSIHINYLGFSCRTNMEVKMIGGYLSATNEKLSVLCTGHFGGEAGTRTPMPRGT